MKTSLKTSRVLNIVGILTALGMLAAFAGLTIQPVKADDPLSTVERFELHGVLATGAPDILGVTLPVKGSHVGSGSTLTFSVVNGAVWTATPGGALCSTKYGSGVVNTPDAKSSSISFAVSGIGCSDGVNAMSTLSYVITGGTGRYAGAVGAGSFSYGEATGTAPGSSALAMDGNIQRP
jgi:hypothetical protein